MSTVSISARETDVSPTDPVTEAVVTAIADAKDVSPLDVSPPLYDAVDPDALEALVDSLFRAPNGSTASFQFTYCQYDVTVTGDGQVSVSRSADENP